ncbi:MAG: hypothetical protein WA916_06070 [Arcobacter sp.]|uniref:hypothetical protein n=1 Tax=Arcobacter sp. TaxID=1872629 RepID=UPI003C726583
MKFIFSVLLLINTLFAYNIICKGDIGASSFYDLSALSDYSYITSGGKLEDSGHLTAEMDPANGEIPYYADSSPVCGGNSDTNLLVEAFCSWKISYCWEITGGPASANLLNHDGLMYTNNTIIVNGYPCLPYGINSISFGVYDWDTNQNIGIYNFNLSDIFLEHKKTVTKEVAKKQRETCKDKPDVDLIPYIDDWENLKANQITTLTNLNEKLNINSYDFELNNLDLEKEDNNPYDFNLDITDTLNAFSNDFDTSMKTSFYKYSNVFGIGGYGSAPTPIKFNLLGQSYSLFDVNTFNNVIPFIRLTLLSFSYIWGSIIILKMPV